MKYRSIQYGVIIISVLCILVLMITMLFYYSLQQKQNEEVKALTFEQRNKMIESVLSVKRQQVEAIINENSAWDDFREKIVGKVFDKEWYYDNIGTMPESYGGADVAVFDAAGSLVYECFGEGYDGMAFFKDVKITAIQKNSPKSIFFNYTGDRLFEYFCGGIVHSDDINTRKETPVGTLIMVREINDELCGEYAEILGGIQTGIVRNGEDLEELKAQSGSGVYFSSVALNNQYQHPVAYMYFISENEIEKVFSRMIPVLIFIAAAVLITFFIMAFFMRNSVVKPLMTMAEIFSKEDFKKVKKLKRNKNEFGMLAGYIEKFFDQKMQLETLNTEMQASQEQLVSQNNMLTESKREIENQIENIKVLNTQIMERNKETEKKNVRIFVQNEQLKQQAEALRQHQENIEKLNYELQFNTRTLEATNVLMTASKNYALRLKDALMVALTPAKHIFQDFFVVQLLKEKVGGDFVFAKKIDKWVIAGVGDCNMDGIPGSLISALDIFIINEIFDLTKAADLRPDLLLNTLNKKIISASTGDELDTDHNRDGLHISLFMYNTETYKASFAAAKCTMITVRDGEITEYFGDNLSVGKITDDKGFRTVEMKVLPGDLIYMYSDGCTEITGGPFCKKLTHANFKKQIVKEHAFPLSVQKSGFKHFYEDWIGSLDQSDDITLLAFKI